MSIAQTWFGRAISMPRSRRGRSVPRLGLCRARTPVQRLDPHAPHQRLSDAGQLAPIGSQKTAQHPRPREGELQMQPVDRRMSEIGRRRRARQVIHRAPRKTAASACFVTLTHDHGRSRFALSNPALGARPLKNRSPASTRRSRRQLFKSTPGADASLLSCRTPRPRRRGAGWRQSHLRLEGCRVNDRASLAHRLS